MIQWKLVICDYYWAEIKGHVKVAKLMEVRPSEKNGLKKSKEILRIVKGVIHGSKRRWSLMCDGKAVRMKEVDVRPLSEPWRVTFVTEDDGRLAKRIKDGGRVGNVGDLVEVV